MPKFELNQEQLFDAIFNKLHLHPIDALHVVQAMTVLRSLGVKQNNSDIIQEYNGSDRIAKAFASLKRNSQDTGGKRGRKFAKHVNIDDEREGDQGGT